MATKFDGPTDQEKSVLLAQAMGWYQVDSEPIMGARWKAPDKPDQHWFNPPNLYNPANMPLAWRVLNWAWGKHDRMVLVINEKDEVVVKPLKYWTWRLLNVLWEAGVMEPEKAARHILDSIFNLAIEAGLIVLSEEQSYKYFGDVHADDLL